MSTSAGRRSSSSSARSGGGRGGAKRENVHQTAARLQREGNLPRESRPEEHGTVDSSGRLAPDAHFDVKRLDEGFLNPAAPPDPSLYARVYGEENVAAALSRATTARLREAAQERGLSDSGSRASLISRLTAHATQGRYSANFPTAKPSPEQKAQTAHAARIAKMEAQVARLQAEINRMRREGPQAARMHSEMPRTSEIARPLTAVRPTPDYQIQLRSAPDARFIAYTFGLGQLREALGQRSLSDVRKAAAAVENAHPGTRPASRSKNGLIDYIYQQQQREGELAYEQLGPLS